MKRKSTALILSGGGNRGALQAGALQALFERGFSPDILVGTSAGALNAAFLAYDPGLAQVKRLAGIWTQLSRQNVYPGNRLSMVWRALSGAPSLFSNEKLYRYLKANSPAGIHRFQDFERVRLYIVAAQNTSGAVRVFGDDLAELVLDALMASTAIPPLLPPWCLGDECLVDGGLAANLPVSVALARGATELWAIQVASAPSARPNPEDVFGAASRALSQILANQTQAQVERLRQAGGHLITVNGFEHLAPWDFSHSRQMIAAGYQQARQQLAWQIRPRSKTRRRLGSTIRHLKPRWLGSDSALDNSSSLHQERG